jgi:protein transport protein SEC61 subunit alpha
MSSLRLINLVQPLRAYLPEVEAPLKRQAFREKLLWTAVTLLIYLICCQIPLYGTVRREGSEALNWLRIILASSKGTLMEFGIAPIITSSMIMQLLAGAHLIEVNRGNRKDRELFQAT